MVTERRLGVNPIEISPVLATIPSYKEFKTGSELQAGSKQLVKDYPALVDSGFLHMDVNFGRSTEGRPIELMTVGKGKKKALWVGTPHPNEAVGTLAIDFLSRYLCEHPEITEKLDTTFVFIKNADPDGFVLNEAWLKGEMDPLKYALGFYRPPFKEQVEWGFPADYKDLHFHNPSAEVRTLMKAFKTYQPEFYYSLHNIGFRNPSYLLSHNIPNLYPTLEEIVTNQGQSVYTGDPEAPYYEKYADGFFGLPSLARMYDYFASGKEKDVDMNQILGGANSREYLQSKVPKAISFMSEVPYFTADALEDETPSGMSRSDMLLVGAIKRKQISSDMSEQFNALQEKLPDSRLKRAVASRIELMNGYYATLQDEVKKPEYKEEATKAEVYNAVQVDSFHEVIQLGQVYQLALQAGEINQAEQIKAYIKIVIDAINEISPIKPIPIQKLVAIQVGAGLVTQQHLSLAD
jgi:hypothetical protein